MLALHGRLIWTESLDQAFCSLYIVSMQGMTETFLICRRQNSSSEEFDLRSGAHHDKTGAKHVLNPKSLSVSSPRSIGNLRSQNDAKTSDAWKGHGKLGQISAQNSGSSSSSGKVPNDSPNTVLPHSLEGEGMNGKVDFTLLFRFYLHEHVSFCYHPECSFL